MAEEDAPALYEQLGSTDWKVRESAQAALLTLAENPSDSLLTQGVEAMVKGGDPEVKFRVKKVLRTAIFIKFKPPERAFLGVGLRDSGAKIEINKKEYLPIDISYVVPNTPAQKGGIQMGYAIIQVDEHECNEDFQSVKMIEYISSHQPGDKMDFTFWVFGRIEKKNITLGHRPAMASDPPKRQLMENHFQKWLREEIASSKERLAVESSKR